MDFDSVKSFKIWKVIPMTPIKYVVIKLALALKNV